MPEVVVWLLGSVRIDDSREFIGFRFKNADGAEHSVQIDFAYVESHAGLFQQAYVSRVMEAR